MTSSLTCLDRRARGRSAGRARRGFALIEMMITITVFSFGLLALSSYAVTLSRQMREGGAMVLASNLARTRFERLRAQRCDLLTAGTSTVVTSNVTETYTVTPGSRSVAVVNQVSFPVGRTRKAVTFQTMIPCPARP